MGRSLTKRQSGFSLLEMIVAVGLGSLVLAAAVQLFTQGVGATFTVSQRAEMQQDFRAASNMVLRDLSLAGAGLGDGVAIALPSAITPVYGCDQTATCYINGTAAAYPKQGATPYLYGLIPGWKYGPILNGAAGPTDAVTVVYTDSSFYLNCYTAKITSYTTVTFTLPSPTTCVLPNAVTPQNVNDQVVGLTPGDLVWFSFNPSVVAEVTNINSNVVTFANSDVLKFNQTPAGGGLIGATQNTVGTGTRLLVITYYIDNTISPPRLMRQVSGHSPTPVAENIVFLQFNYDLYDSSTGTPWPAQADGGVSKGLLPNQITKINIAHMSMDSTLSGARGGYQGMDLETSVSARDLTYNNNYPITSGP